MWTNPRGYAWQRQLAELILAEDAEAEGTPFPPPTAHRPSIKPDIAASAERPETSLSSATAQLRGHGGAV